MTSKEILSWLENHPEIESLRVAICDLNGAMRGKGIPVSQAKKALQGEVRMPLSVAGVDIWGEDIVGSEKVFESCDADGICEWTGRDIVPVNWLAKPIALIPLWLREEGGEAFLGDPRRALASIVDRYAALGLTPVVATELEFYLVDAATDRPVPCSISLQNWPRWCPNRGSTSRASTVYSSECRTTLTANTEF